MICFASDIYDINSFFQISSKKNNDKFNKVRESILQNIINNNIPIDYYQDSKWKLIKIVELI